jgi:hypothetical protein
MPSAGSPIARVGGHGGLVAIDFGYIVRALPAFSPELSLPHRPLSGPRVASAREGLDTRSDNTLESHETVN